MVRDDMTIAEAAKVLGVSARQVQRLAAGGQLGRVHRVGRAITVSPEEVYRAKGNGTTRRGRPAESGTAWHALRLLSGARVTLPAERRLATRIASMEPLDVARFARHRATAGIFRVTVYDHDFSAESLVEGGVVLTGLSSPLVYRWGLAEKGADRGFDGYVFRGDTEDRLRRAGLRVSPRGRIRLRVTEESVSPLPEAAVALDLMESMDSRVREVGTDRLSLMIGALRDRA